VEVLKAALMSLGKPGQASAAAMQCLTDFLTLLCPPNDAAHHPMPTAAVADCAERNNQVSSAATDRHDLNQ